MVDREWSHTCGDGEHRCLIGSQCTRFGKVTMSDIDEVYHRRLSASKELLYMACEGFIEEHHTFMLKTIRKSMEQTQEVIDEITERIRQLLSPYENVVELLREVPGLNTKTVEDLIAEIGLDMSQYPSEKHIASWAGICPGNNESAGKKSSRTNPGNEAVLPARKWKIRNYRYTKLKNSDIFINNSTIK